MEGEKRKAKGAVDAMKGELQRVLQMSQEFLNSPRKDAGPDVKDGPAAAAVVAGPPSPTSSPGGGGTTAAWA
ncbi:hypothetical protein CDD83_1829 [Cordyceps sp. RAO-2017]|nr:hypothetical protein CDD83_1829 [Cordyceps sp. RAO-2017]